MTRSKSAPTRRRRDIAAAQATRGGALRAWHAGRHAVAAVAFGITAGQERQKARRKARAERRGDTGPQIRVEAYTGPSPARFNADGTVRRGGMPVVTEHRPGGNHAERRARGQRSRPCRPRRRELRTKHPLRAGAWAPREDES